MVPSSVPGSDPTEMPQASGAVDAPVASNGGSTPPASLTGGFSKARVISLAVVGAMVVVAYAPNFRELVRIWSVDPNYSHGFLVVPIALVILWQRLKGSSAAGMTPAPWGWVALAVVLTARALCYEWGEDWRETVTLLPALACLALTFGGWPLLRRAWPAILFLGFMLPLPTQINGALARPLQLLATWSSRSLLRLSGLWVVSEGNIIVIGTDRLEVAEACNGLSMLMCLAATIAGLTILLPMAWWKRAALIASIVPVALLSNVLRIVATGWCYYLFGAKTGGHFAHDAAGWLMMPLALVLVLIELAVLSWLIIEERPVESRPMI